MPMADQERVLAVLRQAEISAGKRDRLLFEFMLGTGARLTATLGIDRSDVSTDAGEVALRVEKGRHERVVEVPVELRCPLLAHLDECHPEAVFSGRNGTRLTTRQAQRRFQGWVECAGIRGRWTPHSLRHSFATGLYRRTKDVLLVRESLGHRSLSSTLVYVASDAR